MIILDPSQIFQKSVGYVIFHHKIHLGSVPVVLFTEDFVQAAFREFISEELTSRFTTYIFKDFVALGIIINSLF